MYYRVPIVNGKRDMDDQYLIEGIQLSNTEAVVHLRPCEPRPSWIPITQEEFESYRPMPEPQPATTPPMTQAEMQELLLAISEAVAAQNEKGGTV